MLERHRPDAMLKPIFGQSVLALFYRCAGAIVTFIFSVTFARIMRIDEYGVLVSLLPFCAIAGTIASLGQQTQMLRDIPKLLAQQNYSAITQIASRRLAFVACGGLAVTAVGVCLFIAGRGAIFSRWEYAVSLLLISPLALIETQNAIGCAFGSIYLAIGPKEVLWRLSVAILGIAIFFVGGEPLNAATVLGLSVLIIWLIVAIQQSAVRRLMDGRPLFAFSALLGGNTPVFNFGASVPFWINSTANMMFPAADIVIISIMIGPEAAAYYYAAIRIAMLLDFFISSFAIPAAPRIARLYDAGHREAISQMASNAALLSVAAVLAALVILSFGGALILQAFGHAFVRAHGLLLLLAVGQLGSAYLGIGTPALEMTGHQEAAMRITTVTAFAGLLAMVIATTEFGVWGTAAAAILALLARKAATAAHIYVAEGIDITATSAILERVMALRGKLVMGRS